MRPIAACAMVVVERTRVSQVTPESPGIPRAMVYGLLRDLPGDNFATVACGNDRKLDISVKMSGPYDLTVRLGIARLARQSVHRIPCPTSVTIAKRPSARGGMGRVVELICPTAKAEFCPSG